MEPGAFVEEQVEFNTLKWQSQRAVIVQRYYLEMSEKDMSETLDSPPGNS